MLLDALKTAVSGFWQQTNNLFIWLGIIQAPASVPAPARLPAPAAPTRSESIHLLKQMGEDGKRAASLLRAPFKSPDKNAWLNDIIVDNFIGRLRTDSITNLTSIDYNGREKLFAILRGSPEYQKDKRYKARKERTLKQLNDAKQILWPAALGNHWYLINITQRTDTDYHVQCVDGFNDTPTHQDLFAAARDLINIMTPNAKITTESLTITPQNNTNDCGVVICYYARDLSQGKTLEPAQATPKSYESYRWQILTEIAQQPKALLTNFGNPLLPPTPKASVASQTAAPHLRPQSNN